MAVTFCVAIKENLNAKCLQKAYEFVLHVRQVRPDRARATLVRTAALVVALKTTATSATVWSGGRASTVRHVSDGKK